MFMGSLTVAILNWNGAEYLEECLKSIPSSIEAERILVDNASTDDSWKIAEKYGFRVVHADNKHKFITGINTALASANARFVFFSQADVVFGENAIFDMIKVLSIYPNSIVQPIFINKEKIDNAGMKMMWPGYGIGIRGIVKSLGPYKTDVCTSITFLTTREVIQNVGFYDPAYSPAYMEDVDWAIRSKGFAVNHIVARDAIVHHRHNESFSKSYTKKDISDICRRNRRYLIKKHYRGLDRFLRIIVITFLDSTKRIIDKVGILKK